MTNPYYVPDGNPQANSKGLSAIMRTEFASISTGFSLLPSLTGNAGRAFIVNSGGNAVTLTVGTLTLAGNLTLGGDLTTSGALTTTGGFSTIFAQTASVTLTLPGISDTLATLGGTETFTNKTLVSPNMTSPNMTGIPIAPTASALTATTQVATTAFATAAVGVANASLSASIAAETARAEAAEALLAPLASPPLTGVPTAPTAAFLTNSTQIATTAFVATAVTASGALTAGTLFGYTLSNDGTTPNTVLDIATGQAADSLNGIVIALTSPITKSISATWAVGSGNGGMGTGLTATSSTWYHVFAIINSAVVDVYFDSSVTAANKPAGTTSFRRIGSFYVSSAGHITPFFQTGDRFDWTGATWASSFTGTIAANTTMTVALLTPNGLPTEAIISGSVGSSTNNAFYISSLYTASFVPSPTSGPVTTVGTSAAVVAFNIRAFTDASSSVRLAAGVSGSGVTVDFIVAIGWVDRRGK